MSMTDHAAGFWTCTLKWHDTSKLSLFRRCIWTKSLTKRNFKAGSWISEQKFAQRRRISRSHCSGSRKSKQPARCRTSSIQNQLRAKNSLIMKNWIWWWRQKWSGATTSIRTSNRGSASKSRELKRTTDFSEGVRLLIWSTKLQSVEPWQKGKGQNSFTERKTGECFQRKTIGSCSRRDTCSFLHTHATGDRDTTREEVGDARRSRQEQASSSVPKVKEQTDVKS